MANPQLEDGYLRIANKVWDALIAIRIPGRARQILDFIIRKTWGYGKQSDHIPLSQMNKATGIPSRQLHRELAKLRAMNLITQKGDGKSVSYSFNKNYDKWNPSPRKVTSPRKVMTITQKGDKRHLSGGQSSPRKVDSKDILKDKTKDILKDTLSPKKSGDHQILIDRFCQLYLEHKVATSEGVALPYNFKGAEDGAKIKRFRKAFDLDTALRIVEQLFLTEDPLIIAAGYTIGVLCGFSNKLAQEIEKKEVNYDCPPV